MNTFEIIKTARLTEKGTRQGEKLNQYTLVADRRANMTQIRQAGQGWFKVKGGKRGERTSSQTSGQQEERGGREHETKTQHPPPRGPVRRPNKTQIRQAVQELFKVKVVK